MIDAPLAVVRLGLPDATLKVSTPLGFVYEIVSSFLLTSMPFSLIIVHDQLPVSACNV